MKLNSVLSVASIVFALVAPTAAFAQEEHLIGNKVVPADQVEAVQTKCDELRAAEPATEAPAPEGEGPPETETPATSDGVVGWSADGTSIDLEKLTIDLCDEGKFMANAE